MTDTHKKDRYCIPCGTKGTHTSTDHSKCPTKREIVRERAREAREKKNTETQDNKRDLELITRVFDYTNTEAWPKIQANPHQLYLCHILVLSDPIPICIVPMR